MKHVEVNDREISVANVDGKFYAIDDRCGHQKVPLSMGTLDGRRITCPLHAAVFDITTGENLEGVKLAAPQGVELPKEVVDMFSKTMEIIVKVKIEPLKKYPVQVTDGKIRVGLE
jgi:nitrite reductase/ring-hydroxylating ferredoxin subunit